MLFKSRISNLLMTLAIATFCVQSVEAGVTSGLRTPSKLTLVVVEPLTITSEFEQISQKTVHGRYGSSAAEQLMLTHQVSLVNFLSVQKKIKTCNELKGFLPALKTGFYYINGHVEKCVGNSIHQIPTSVLF